MMNCMKRYSTSAIFISVLLVFSIFTLIYISEVNAAEVISVNAKGYENTIIIEFENESVSKIKTIKVWPGGEVTFTSFKSEPGWGGGKYSDCKLLIFTATNMLNPGESIKFGLVTNEKVTGINWKALDQNDRKILRNIGVKFGRFHIYLHKLLKPEAVALRLILWKNFYQKYYLVLPVYKFLDKKFLIKCKI